jgi:myo-inositol-1(or 4)-monophosphatase
MLSAPPINFPLDEVNQRLDFLREKTIYLINEAKDLQKQLSFSNNLSDEQEKSLIDKVDSIFDEEIHRLISHRFSKDHYYAETLGVIEGDSDFSWVVDSIDGTMNFLRKIPLYAISLGLEYRNTTVAAYIILPEFNSVYLSVLGEGAYQNGTKIFCSEIHSLDRALLISSFPYNRKSNLRETIAEVASFVTTGRSMRRTGSLVIDLCWLADGKIDGLWEKNVDRYDLSAASLILKEAGGKLTDISGNDIVSYPTSIVASNQLLHQYIVDVLQKTRKELSYN